MKDFPFDDSESYIRVQTSYFKQSLKPTINGKFSESWTPWSAEMLKMDLGKYLMEKIRFGDWCRN